MSTFLHYRLQLVVRDLQNSIVLVFDLSSSLADDTRTATPRAKSIIHNSSFNSILLSGFPTKYHSRNAREKAANETPYYSRFPQAFCVPVDQTWVAASST